MDNKIYEIIEAAESLRRKSKYREALVLFMKARTLSQKRKDLGGLLDANMAAADVCRIMGDFDGSVEFYTEALELCEGLCNDLTAADAMVGLGLSYRAVGMWQKAIRLITKARKIYIAAGDKKGMAFALWAEAGSLRVAGKIPAAIETFKEAKRIFTAVKFEPGIAYSLAGLGGTHRIAGETAESLKYYLQANEMFHSLRDTFGTAYTHCGVGNANRMMNNYGKALGHFRKATRLYEEIGDIVSYSYTLWSLAMVYKMKGDLIQTGELVRQARRNFKKTKDPRGIIYCDLADGEVAWMEGNNRKAHKMMKSALANAEQHKFKLEACHARLLLLHSGQVYRKGAAAKNPPCYKKIGVGLNFGSMPFNIP